jgi:pimeloyl-ACP methyl ester carboxylesterase
VAYYQYNGRNVFYEEVGQGFPLLLLHGNSVSSKLFEHVLDLYKDNNRVLLIDFLGHGKSDRLQAFPADFWYDEAMQAIRLIEHSGYGKVNLIGTSGGALAALNVALERGDLVNAVVADSFEGEAALDTVVLYIPEERKQSKAQAEGPMLWGYCHGEDWESVVDNDTAVCIQHYSTIKRFFHKDLSALTVPALLTASLEDEFAAVAGLDFSRLYGTMANKIADCRVHLFQTGGHPAMLTNAAEFAGIAQAFFGAV